MRLDDGGSCPSANSAVLECLEAGLAKNASLMVPGPAFGELAMALRGRKDVDLGLHATLNSEWNEVRWGPVASPADVPSLLDDDGRFTRTPNALHERFRLEEAMVEIRAQLGAARDAGLEIRYLDEHMGVGWVGGLRAALREFSYQENLIFVEDLALRPMVVPCPNSIWSRLEPGDYLAVLHPGRFAPDMEVMFEDGVEPGRIARARDADRLWACSPSLARAWDRAGVSPARFTEVASISV